MFVFLKYLYQNVNELNEGRNTTINMKIVRERRNKLIIPVEITTYSLPFIPNSYLIFLIKTEFQTLSILVLQQIEVLKKKSP